MLGFLLTFAEATVNTQSISVSDGLSVLQTVGQVGFSVWFGYYVITKMIPRLQAQHQQTVDKLNETHATTLRDMNSEMKSQRETFSTELRLLRDTVDRIREAAKKD